jgi:hypothetical protein
LPSAIGSFTSPPDRFPSIISAPEKSLFIRAPSPQTINFPLDEVVLTTAFLSPVQAPLHRLRFFHIFLIDFLYKEKIFC